MVTALQQTESASEPHAEGCTRRSHQDFTISACLPCPCHIGVALSDEFNPYHHLPDQQYDDDIDGTSRARNSVRWVAHKGDMVPLSGPFRKIISVIRRLTPTGSSAGTVTVVLSMADGTSPARHFSQTGTDLPSLPPTTENHSHDFLHSTPGN